ncbi:recombinase family protein [Hydrogenophaga sp.]|uniref:recombinase family protein n=1 Tax=Hydrogenophaga sp. TaxID=1904254 RepID=UPI0039FD9015
MQIVGPFAEFERAMLRERTRNGLEEARKQGRVGGRKPSLTPQQEKEVVAMVTSGQKSGAEVERLFRVIRLRCRGWWRRRGPQQGLTDLATSTQNVIEPIAGSVNLGSRIQVTS